MIKALAIKGGGDKGKAYPGCLQKLEDLGALHNLEAVAGTSVGAITALCVSLGYTAEQIKQISFDADLSALLGSWSIFRPFGPSMSIYSNKRVINWITGLMAPKIKPTATFLEMHMAGSKDFICVATHLNTQDSAIFSYSRTPNTSVLYAALASMSVPGVFPEIRFPDLPGLFCDGGAQMNYPIYPLQARYQQEEILGLYVHNFKPAPFVEIRNPFQMAIAAAESAISANDVLVRADPVVMKRTVLVDSLGISALQDVTEVQAENLYDSGYRAISQAYKNGQFYV